MRILIILLLFIAPLSSNAETTVSASSLYGVSGMSWPAGPHNPNNGWPCGEWAGNVFCYTASQSEMNQYCYSYPSGGVPYGNRPNCTRIENGGLRQGYPLVIGFESGAIYDKETSCEITIRVYTVWASLFGNGSISGFTKAGTNARWTARFNNCREAIIGLGVKHGYGSNWYFKTNVYPGGNHGWADICIDVDGHSIGCSSSSSSTTPPTPATCNISVPLTLDYGVVNSKEIDGAQQDVAIDYQCNKSANVSFSLLGGTSTNSGVSINMGGGLTSELCFLTGNTCPNSGGGNIKVTGINGSVKLRSNLKGSNISGGDYSSSVTLVSTFY